MLLLFSSPPSCLELDSESEIELKTPALNAPIVIATIPVPAPNSTMFLGSVEKRASFRRFRSGSVKLGRFDSQDDKPIPESHIFCVLLDRV